MKKTVLTPVMFMTVSCSVGAELAPNASLSINAASNFGINTQPGGTGFWIDVSIAGFNGIHLGTGQPASGAHAGWPDGTENPGIDEPWTFFNDTGMHQSNSPVVVISDDGAGNVTLDFSGWAMAWSSYPNMSLGSGEDAGIATMTCAVDCSAGETYTLSYLATLPLDDTSPFAGLDYRINLTGTISEPVPPPGLPPGSTLLTIEPGVYVAGGMCNVGTCFGMEVAPGFWIWTLVEPGTDGGIVVGKDQASGGQELIPGYIGDTTPGEMTAAWNFYGNYGTFSSLPGGAANIYHNAPCVAAECLGKTEIQAFYAAWNNYLYPLGGGTVNSWDITLDGAGGGSYALDYETTVQGGGFTGVNYRLIARGNVLIQNAGNYPPVASDINISGVTNTVIDWQPDFSDPDAADVHSCEITVNANNGYAAVNPDCSAGSYTSGSGYEGNDSFSYKVTDLAGSSSTAAVSVVVEPVPGSCTDLYRLKQVTSVGGGQGQSVNSTMTTTFTGNITTESGLVSGGKNVAKICPGTVLGFTTNSSAGEATCATNGAVSGSSGSLTVGDKLICSNKPDGSDVDRFSIKSGI